MHDQSARGSPAAALRVLAFGTYQRDYPRNAQVRSCLRAAGIDVVERHASVWDGRRDAWSTGLGTLPKLVAAELRLAFRGVPDTDALLVGYPGHADVPAARHAAHGRPVVFDPLVSLYDTLVVDRRRFRARSLFAHALFTVDRTAFRLADLVIADTAAQAAFYEERFELAPDRIRVCFVGAEERLFFPGPPADGPFHALFVGKLIPLHGLDTILAAARIAREIPFRIVGSGQLARELESMPANVTHVPWVEYERLPAELRSAGCALGIFGTSPKATRVIPNKAYQALACAVPLVTADTPGARELLTDGEDALLVPPGDAQALADAVRLLARDRAVAARIGATGRATYERAASEAFLGERWRAVFDQLTT
jgi:glycosyltransferase involved in cell wall biosynthesis